VHSSSRGWLRLRPAPCGGGSSRSLARGGFLIGTWPWTRRRPWPWHRPSPARAAASAAALRVGHGRRFLGHIRCAFGHRCSGCRLPQPSSWRALASCSACSARSAFSRSRASASSRMRRFSASSSSWRRINSAWRRASSSRRVSSASSICGAGRSCRSGALPAVAGSAAAG